MVSLQPLVILEKTANEDLEAENGEVMTGPIGSSDLMINFNGMSTSLELFYANRLENHVHCTFIFAIFVKIIYMTIR